MFKFHYPARGRKRFRVVKPIKNLPMKFKFHYPARGRKRVLLRKLLTVVYAFKFHYPARGRKHCRLWRTGCRLTGRVQIPLPRKGTETKWSSTSGALFHRRSNSITPQGDGNRIDLRFEGFDYNPVQIPLPRKGTETQLTSRPSSFAWVFKFHYPARGRKHLAAKGALAQIVGSNSITPQGGRKRIQSNQRLHGSQWFKFHYPARGRKRVIMFLLILG